MEGMKAKTHYELLDEWLVGIKIRVLSHYSQAKYLERLDRFFGVPTVIFSAITSVVSASAGTSSTMMNTTTCLSVLVTVMSGVVSFLKCKEQAAMHKSLANDLCVLRRAIEMAMLTDVTAEVLAEFCKRWNEIDKNAPLLPDSIYARFSKVVKENEESKNDADLIPVPVDGGDAGRTG